MGPADLPELFACVSGRWSPSIGDPTAMGWATVIAYLFSSLACFEAARLRTQDRGLWAFLFVVLLLLGVNKQFDLQSALTAVGRCAAQIQGWYDDRRQVQFWFILALLIISSAVFVFAFVRMMGRLARVGFAVFGFGLLLTFVAVRAVGFHHFDEMIGMTVAGARVNWLLELGGIFLIATNAAVAIRVGKHPKTST